jgi:hypothetical protein
MTRLATIGWETGSIDEFPGESVIGNACVLQVTSGSSRTGNYKLYATATGTSIRTTYRKLILGGNYSEIYARVPFMQSLSGTWVERRILHFLDSADNIQFEAWLNRADKTISFYVGEKSTLIGSCPIYDNAWNTLHIRYKVDSVAGIIQAKVNSAVINLDFNGNTQATVNANISAVCPGQTKLLSDGDTSCTFDDLGVNDTSGSFENSWLPDAGILFLRPSGNGDLSQLVGSDSDQVDNYLLVDEAPPNTTDFVGSASVDESDTYALQDVPASYLTGVLVQPYVYSALATAGLGGIRNRLRAGGVNYDDDSDSVLTTTYGWQRGKIYYKDPADNATWTAEKINGYQAGMVVK